MSKKYPRCELCVHSIKIKNSVCCRAGRQEYPDECDIYEDERIYNLNK